MLCKKCGAEMKDNADFCPQCGEKNIVQASEGQTSNTSEATPAQNDQPQSVQNANTQQATQQPAYAQSDAATMPQNQQYTTMGGWLLFFMIIDILGIIGLVLELVVNSSSFAYLSYFGMGGIAVLAVIELVVAAVLMTVHVVFTFSKKPQFLLVYQLASLIALVLDIICIIFVAGLQIMNISSMIPSVIGSAVGLILMTLYYCKSVRVQTYMGNTDYIDKAIIKFRP